MLNLIITKNADFLTGEKKVKKTFTTIKSLKNYFINNFYNFYSYNQYYWNLESTKWFSKKIGFSDDNTIYYFGSKSDCDFLIKLTKEQIWIYLQKQLKIN